MPRRFAAGSPGRHPGRPAREQLAQGEQGFTQQGRAAAEAAGGKLDHLAAGVDGGVQATLGIAQTGQVAQRHQGEHQVVSLLGKLNHLLEGLGSGSIIARQGVSHAQAVGGQAAEEDALCWELFKRLRGEAGRLGGLPLQHRQQRLQGQPLTLELGLGTGGFQLLEQVTHLLGWAAAQEERHGFQREQRRAGSERFRGQRLPASAAG